MPLPKYLQEIETTRSRSNKQEHRIAKELKGKTTINSGATFGENDVIVDFCEIEAKTTKKDSFSVTYADIKKMSRKCSKVKIPIMVVDFEEYKKSVVVMDYQDFLLIVKNK